MTSRMGIFLTKMILDFAEKLGSEFLVGELILRRQGNLIPESRWNNSNRRLHAVGSDLGVL